MHQSSHLGEDSTTSDNSALLADIARRGGKWLRVYQFGAAIQTLFAFLLILFRRPLGIPDQFVPVIAIMAIGLWTLYSFWLAHLILHSFSRAFWFVGLVQDQPESPWLQITPPWLKDYERFVEANAHSLLLQAALRGALIYIHQVPNHLQALEGSLTIAMRRLHTVPSDAEHALVAARAEVHRLGQFISALRAFVDQDTASQDTFDICATVRLMRSRHPDASKIAIDESALQPIMVVGCEPMVRQVFANVLNNASRYGTGDILIACHDHPESGRVELIVYDGGDSLTPNQQHLAFRVNPRIVAAGPHLGLGLPLSRHLMRHQGGDVKFVRSNELSRGKGVAIVLPRPTTATRGGRD